MTNMRGICKGFKYISHIFVVKEEEIEIGFPTDVKHVAHIGWDGPSGSAPSWMTEFKAAPEFSSSLGTMNEHTASAHSSGASSRELSVGLQNSELAKDGTPSDVPKMPKKPKRKKVKSNSSPKASSSPKGSSPVTKSSRATKTKLKHQHADDEKIPS